ncbi:MAG: translocation/assembly module TamB, partial [Alphaproteobacteria bacterium]|nr:translocation/assembly module TamB [Alphaproteobacteria bacterium]
LKGSGPIADWRGNASIEVGDATSMSADVTLKKAAALEFDVAGKARFAAPDDARLKRLVAGDHAFTLAGSFGPRTRLAVRDFKWDAAAFALALDGWLDTKSLDVDARLSAQTKGAASVVLEGLSAQSVNADAAVSGNLRESILSLKTTAKGLTGPEFALGTFAGTATLRPKQLDDGRFLLSDVEASGSLDGLRVTPAPELGKLIGNSLQWRMTGSADLRRATVEAETLSVEGQAGALKGKGAFNFAVGSGEMETTVGLSDLSRLKELAGVTLSGRLTLSAKTAIERHGDDVTVTFDGRADGFASGEAILDRLLTANPKLDGKAIVQDGAVTLHGVKMTSTAASLDVAGTVSTHSTLDGDYHLAVKDGVDLPLDPALAVRCPCDAKGKLAGALDDPRIDGTVSASALPLDPLPLRDLSIRYDLDKIASAMRGTVKGGAQSQFGALTAQTGVSVKDSHVRLTGLTVDGVDTKVQGTLAIPIDGGALTGDLDISVADLRPWLRHADFEGSGKATAKLTLRPDGTRQGAEASAEATDPWLDGLAAGERLQVARLTATVKAKDIGAQEGMTLDADLHDVVAGAATLKELSVSATGSPKRARGTIDLSGHWVDPVTLKAVLDYAAQDDKQTLSVTTLTGKLLGESISLRQPLNVAWQKNAITLDATELAIGSGGIRAQLRADDKSVDGSLTLRSLTIGPLDRLYHLGLQGAVDGTVSVRGPLSAPTGTVSVKSQDLRYTKLAGAEKVAFSMTGDWRDGRLKVDGGFSSPNVPPAVVAFDIPLVIDAAQRSVDVPRDQPVTGTLKWQGEIATIWPLIPLGEHELSGEGQVDARLRGTLEAPELKGQATIRNGVYEGLELGTVLRPLEVSVDFDGTQAKITKFTAGDGGRGKMTVQGQIACDPAAAYPFDVRADLTQLAVVRRDDVDATASGQVSVEGSMDKAKILGRLTTDLVEIYIPERLPPNVVNLHVTDADKPVDDDAGIAGHPEARSAEAQTLDPSLDVTVDMPRRVFVRGRGIDSEWKGDITVGGTVEHPRPTGTISLVRGQMNVVGKTFKLEDGELILEDGKDAEPRIYVRAVYTGTDITATARAAGPLSKPVITLSSVPELPQDEIVSRILFNKSASRLNGFEAAQLALALADLSGAGGGVGNFMNLARKTLGVDVLRVDSQATSRGDQPVLEAGKYLTDDVYLDVKQGATPEASSVGVGVELTPNVSVESDMRQSGASDVGVKFKLDY